MEDDEQPSRRRTDRTDWLVEELRLIRREQREAHTRLRTDFDDGLDRVQREVNGHSVRLGKIDEARKLEASARGREDRHAVKAGRVAAALATLGLTALIELAKSLRN